MVSDVGFFAEWFETLSWEDLVDLYQAVSNEQLTFVSGFWTTPDEAVTHYTSIINDMTLGRQWLRRVFRDCGQPFIAWQLKALGHSNTFAEILINSGYEGLFMSRTDYKHQIGLTAEHSLIFNWKPGNLRQSDSILTILTPHSSPPTFSFESNFFPISQEELNAGATEEFVNYVKKLTTTYGTGEVFVLFGGDFSFKNSEIHYKSIDALIEAVRNDASYGVDIFYSSPNCYFKSIKDGNAGLPGKPYDPLMIFTPNQANFKTRWPTNHEKDFLPVADDEDPTKIFSGYYSTNPNLKYDIRQFESLMLSVTQLKSIKSILDIQSKLGSELKVKQEAAFMQTLNSIGSVSSFLSLNETNARLAKSFNHLFELVSASLMDILDALDSSSLPEISVCPIPFTKTCLIDGDSLQSGLIIYVYNPLAHKEVEFVRVSVPETSGYSVTNWQGYEIASQIFASLQRGSLTKDSNDTVPDENHLYFKAILPPLGITSFRIKKIASSTTTTTQTPNNNFISNSKLKVTLNQESGELESVLIVRTSQLINLKQKFIAYKPSLKSSHLVLDPEDPGIELATNSRLVNVNRGTIVQEVNHIVNDYINQTFRLYQDKNFVEIEYHIGQLPNDTVGMELISRFESDLSSNSFVTFSNCREIIERTIEARVRKLPETSAGEKFLPTTCYTSIKDTSKNIQMSVFVDRSLAVSSLLSGSIDLLVQRRIPFKNELIGEDVNYDGITFFTTWISFEADPVELNKLSKKSMWKPLILFNRQQESFNSESDELTNYSTLNQTLLKNLHLLSMETFRPLDPTCEEKQLLLRIENISANETLTLNMEYLFKNVRIFKLTKMNLAATGGTNLSSLNEERKSWIKTSLSDVPAEQTASTTITIEPHRIETVIASFNKIT